MGETLGARRVPESGSIASQGGRISDGAVSTGGSPSSTGGTGSTSPSTTKVFDQVPQFGIYATSNPESSPRTAIRTRTFHPTQPRWPIRARTCGWAS